MRIIYFIWAIIYLFLLGFCETEIQKLACVLLFGMSLICAELVKIQNILQRKRGER